MSADKSEAWERFYGEHRRPWRGVAKIPDIGITPGCRALDIGCGNGKTTLALLEAGAKVTGIDFAPGAIGYCTKTIGDKAEFLTADCRNLPFDDESFDVITMVHVLEHLDDGESAKAASEAERVIVPGGIIFIRSFSEGDLRSEGKEADIRGNGITYQYRTADAMAALFKGCETLSKRVIEEPMRFGGVRVRGECVMKRRTVP